MRIATSAAVAAATIAHTAVAQDTGTSSVRDQIVASFADSPLDIDQPIEELRAAFDAAFEQVPLPQGVTMETRTVAGRPTAILSVPDAANGRVLLYLHGGGYVFGSIDMYAAFAGAVGVAARASVMLPEYRLAPEHPFPAPVEDARAAYLWLLSQGHDPENIVIAGDSAGGGLTVATLLALRDAGDPLPACAVLISPWTDLTGSGDSMRSRADDDPLLEPSMIEWMASKYIENEQDLRNPLASPLFADLQGLPPLLIQVGSDEILLSDATRLAANAAAAEVDVTLRAWPDMFHVWHFYHRMLPEAKTALDEAGAFVAKHAGAP